MTISIHCISYKRAGHIEVTAIPNIIYWVHASEYELYKSHYPFHTIHSLADAMQGNTAAIKNHILSVHSSDDVVVFIDDMVQSIGYWEQNEEHELASNEIQSFFETYSQLVKEWKATIWGIASDKNKHMYAEFTPFSLIQTVTGGLVCILDTSIRFDERFHVYEDHDLTISQCRTVRRVVKISKYFLNKKYTKKGGKKEYITPELKKTEKQLLRDKWGETIVRRSGKIVIPIPGL